MSDSEVLNMIRNKFAMDSSIHEDRHTSKAKSVIQLEYMYIYTDA